MTVALCQAVGSAAAWVGRAVNVFVSGLAVTRRNGIVTPVGQLLEGNLDNLEACRNGTVPRSMETDVHVLSIGVEGVPDRGGVGLEAEAGGSGFGVAGRVGVRAVGRQDKVAACFKAAKARGTPYGKAGRVAVPDIACRQGVAD